ncbi:MAG: biopolymer transporter ExbD [Spirochaetota bacterium]|nr:MAG: biopolymer transporter ExbD [Spirochaetota bacterium]
MRFRRSLTTRTNVELIPLIDVVFQLVVFFMVATTFILTPGISLVLPGSETSEPVVMTKLVVTVISRDEIYLNKERYDITNFERRLATLTEEEKEEIKTVVIEGDETVSYTLMVNVLDALRKSGFKGVNLKTREPD